VQKSGKIFCQVLLCAVALFPWAGAQESGPDVDQLRAEVAQLGWIAFSARSENGSWDLFLMRPDGSSRVNITNTPEVEEAAPRFSPGSTKLLWRALPKGTVINHDSWGTQGHVVIAEANGRNPKRVGQDGELPWASWSPDGTQFSCLTAKGVEIMDVETGQPIRTMPRHGLYQQLFWSPGGEWFTGVANFKGSTWTVVRMHAETGEINTVKANQNCTPDWFPKSDRVIFSSRPPKQNENNGNGWTFLWTAEGSGANGRIVYGEAGYHIYGGCVSPDEQYVLFTRSAVDGGGSEKDGAPISLVRLADTPMILGESREIRLEYPEAKAGPMLVLTDGWEPHWTAVDLDVE